MSKLFVRLATLVLGTSMVLAVAPAAEGATLGRRTLGVGALAASPASSGISTTSPLEARRVDRVPTPQLRWRPCADGLQCATVRLPLDYDEPGGATVRIALVKSPATNPARRLGSLFLNPGGPGVSATEFLAPFANSTTPALRERYDLVAVDPRGVGAGDQVRCFADSSRQAAALAGASIPFPVGSAETRAFQAAAAALAKACSTTGGALARSMSTAEVARDMDVLRRAVGDQQLNYLGFSYGTHLGATYAALFPDRVRVMALDAAVDPAAWAGRPLDKQTPVTVRLRGGDGAWQTLVSAMAACDRAGVVRCPLAGRALARWEGVAAQLARAPITVEGLDGPVKLTYAMWVAETQQALYGEYGIEYIAAATKTIEELATAPAISAQSGAQRHRRSAALHRLSSLREQWLKAQRDAPVPLPPLPGRLGLPTTAAAGGYDNSAEAYATITCSDSTNPTSPAAWPKSIASSATSGRHFTQSWGWASAWCARQGWKAVDEDAYRGPWKAITRRPVLVVGGLHDPATNHNGAVVVANRLGNARLLSSDHYGHTAYLTSNCATSAIDRYLLTGEAPAAGKTCHAEQPFSGA